MTRKTDKTDTGEGLAWLDTGIEGLGSYIQGFPTAKCTAVVGAPGTGKTLVALHFANRCVEKGMKVVYVASEELPRDLLRQAEGIGLHRLVAEYDERFIIRPVFEDRGSEMDSFYLVDFHRISRDFLTLIKGMPADTDVIIIDNIGVFTVGMDPVTYRDQIDFLVYKLSKSGITTMIISDEAVDQILMRITLHSVNAALRLFRGFDPFTSDLIRAMDVMKVRNSPTPVNYLRYEIGAQGVKVLGEAKGMQDGTEKR